MRRLPLLILSAMLFATGCSEKHAGDSADFEPPVNRVRTDVTANLGERFNRLDADGDGIIDVSEMGGRAGRLRTFDANGDGKVSRAEFETGVMARFDATDTNKDGTVTNAERDAARANRKVD